MDFLDILNIYIIGLAQMLAGFWCLYSFAGKYVNPLYYFLFAGLCLLEIRLFNTIDYFLEWIYVLTLFLTGYFLFKTFPAQSALYSFIINILMSLIYGIANCILTALIIMMPNFMTIVICLITINFAVIASLILIILFVKKHLLYTEIYNKNYTLIILIPIILIYIAEQFINYYIFGNTVNSNANGIEIIFNPFQILTVEIIVGGIVFLILFLYKKLLENLTLNMRVENLMFEGKYLIRYAEETKNLYKKTQSFRHDVKNHLTIINLLLKEHKYEQALAYSNELISNTSNLTYKIETGNPVLNTLLQNKLNNAESLDIEVKCSLSFPDRCNIEDIDLCTIISNAVDNAIDACRILPLNERRYIELNSILQGGIVIIKVKNSYNGIKQIKESTGIKNIKSAASKYNGLVEIETKLKEFTIKILLNLSQRNSDISQQDPY